MTMNIPATAPRGARLSYMLALGFMALVLVRPAQAQQLAPEVESTLLLTDRSSVSSVRLTGMGGASFAGLADHSALFSNPAGLGHYTQSEITGSFSGLSVGDQTSYFNNVREQHMRDYGIGSLSYVYKMPTVRGSLVFGAAYQQRAVYDRQRQFVGVNDRNTIVDAYYPGAQTFGIDAEQGPDQQFGTDDDEFFVDFDNPFTWLLYDAFAIDLDYGELDVDSEGNVWLTGDDDVPFVVPIDEVRQSGRVTEDGAMREASFGGAVEAADGVMIGGSANFSFGSYQATSFYVEEDENDTSPFTELELTDTFESELFGVNVRAGLSAEALPGLQLGLAIESPTYYSISERYSTQLYAQADDGYYDTYGDDASEDFGFGEPEYSVTTPWRVGAGAAYSTPSVTVSADVEFVDWTQLGFDSDLSADYFEGLETEVLDDLGTVVNTRLGGEYRMGPLALRAGFAHRPDPRETLGRQSDGGELDQSRTQYSAGLGYRFAESVQLDLAWAQERYDDQYRPYSGLIYSDSGVANAPVVDDEVVRNRVVVGLRFFF